MSSKLIAARVARANPSPAHAALWRELRQRPGGFKWRQYPVRAGRSFVPDFYCPAVGLVALIDPAAYAIEGWVVDVVNLRSADVLRDPFAAARVLTAVAQVFERCSS